RAKVEHHRENAGADRNTGHHLCLIDLVVPVRRVKQRKLQIVIAVGRHATVGQPPLISEAARLAEECAGAQHDRQHQEQISFDMNSGHEPDSFLNKNPLHQTTRELRSIWLKVGTALRKYVLAETSDPPVIPTHLY